MTVCIHPGKLTDFEPKNHPIEKENHLNQTSIFGFKKLIFQGVNGIFTCSDCSFLVGPHDNLGVSPACSETPI